MSKKTFVGKIVSNKMQNTVVVSVDVPKKHKIYGKNLKFTKRFMCQNTIGAALGELVTIEESRPISKHTTWVVVSKFTEGDN